MQSDAFVTEVRTLMAAKEAELVKLERRMARDRELFEALSGELDALRQTVEVYRAHHRLPAVETESAEVLDQPLSQYSTNEVVIELARLRGGRLNVSEAAKILVRVGMYQTERNASSNIYSAVKRHGQRFRKARPGIYELTEALPARDHATAQAPLELQCPTQPLSLNPPIDDLVLAVDSSQTDLVLAGSSH